MVSLLPVILCGIEDGGNFLQGLKCPINHLPKRTATHPTTVAEVQEGLALGNMLAVLRVVVGRKTVFQGSLLGLHLARYVWTDTVSSTKGVRTSIQRQQDSFIPNSPVHASVFPALLFQGAFPNRVERRRSMWDSCSLIFLRVSLCLLRMI